MAVIGVMMEPGDDNDLFSAIMAAAPVDEGEVPLGEAKATDLLPSHDEFVQYQGSLTTPPCAEVVLWTIMDQPIEVGQADIVTFSKLFTMNARPLQDLSRRYVLNNN